MGKENQETRGTSFPDMWKEQGREKAEDLKDNLLARTDILRNPS